MEWYWLLLALLGSILILMFAGIPVGIAFLAVCTVTAYHLYGRFGGDLRRFMRVMEGVARSDEDWRVALGRL